MAGYSRLYVIGGLGGFQGADGVNPIAFQILVGEGNRQWLEVHYFDTGISPIGKMGVSHLLHEAFLGMRSVLRCAER